MQMVQLETQIINKNSKLTISEMDQSLLKLYDMTTETKALIGPTVSATSPISYNSNTGGISLSIASNSGLSVSNNALTVINPILTLGTNGQVLTSIGNSLSWTTPSSVNNYTLPTATSSILGGVKVGNGLSIISEVLSVTNPLPVLFPILSSTTSGQVLANNGTSLYWTNMASGTVVTPTPSTSYSVYGIGLNLSSNDNNITSSGTPINTENYLITNYTAITSSSSRYNNLIIAGNNELYGIGSNSNGTLGQGTTTAVSNFTICKKSVNNVVSSITNAKSCSCGGLVNAYIDTDNKLWLCGDNARGQLAQGDTTSKDKYFLQENQNKTWTSVCCSYNAVLAIDTDNKLWICGFGDIIEPEPYQNYQLTSCTTFIPIDDNTTWSKISATYATNNGNVIIAGVTMSGILYYWLADEGLHNISYVNVIPYLNKIQIGSSIIFNDVAMMQNGNLIALSNGKLYGCGANVNGVLGMGNTTPIIYQNIAQIGSSTDWEKIYSAGSCFLAINTSGDLYFSGLFAYSPNYSSNNNLTKFKSQTGVVSVSSSDTNTIILK